MFDLPAIQVLPTTSVLLILLYKMKDNFLYDMGTSLMSLHVLANSLGLYVMASLISGNWTARTNGISPTTWLACLALPQMLASRGLRRGSISSSGALAVLQVGFLLTLANLSFTGVFAVYLFTNELKVKKETFTLEEAKNQHSATNGTITHPDTQGNNDRPEAIGPVQAGETSGQKPASPASSANRIRTQATPVLLAKEPHQPKAYFRIVTEMALPIYTAIIHILEFGVGGGRTSSNLALDFGTNYVRTWLAVTFIGSLSLVYHKDLSTSIFKSGIKGSLLGLGYHLTSLTFVTSYDPRVASLQLNIIGAGAFGGAFSALIAAAVKSWLWGEDRRASSNMGFLVLSCTISGLLLPRMLLYMDSTFPKGPSYSHLDIWNNFFSISTASRF